MNKLSEYPKKRIFATTLSAFILGGITTFWAIKIAPPEYCKLKIIVGSIYLIVSIYHSYLVLKRRKYGLEGIIRVHKDSDYSDISKRIEKAKRTIEIIVYHGNNLLYYTKSEIIEALKRDVDVKLLIAQKKSILLKEAQQLESSQKNEDQKRAWETIKEIKKEAKGKTCSIRYFKYSTQARYALIIVDGKWAWWTPYHPGLNVPKTSSFVLADTGEKAIINECKKHFRALWIKLEKEQIKQLKKNQIDKLEQKPDESNPVINEQETILSQGEIK